MTIDRSCREQMGRPALTIRHYWVGASAMFLHCFISHNAFPGSKSDCSIFFFMTGVLLQDEIRKTRTNPCFELCAAKTSGIINWCPIGLFLSFWFTDEIRLVEGPLVLQASQHPNGEVSSCSSSLCVQWLLLYSERSREEILKIEIWSMYIIQRKYKFSGVRLNDCNFLAKSQEMLH